MESIIEHLVKHIGDSMPGMRVVDEDYGQLEMLDQENRDSYPLVFPAVLIDAPDCAVGQHLRTLAKRAGHCPCKALHRLL